MRCHPIPPGRRSPCCRRWSIRSATGGRSTKTQARGWRDREIYLQLQPLPANAPGVAQEHRPVTVSERPVQGAVNLAGRIVFYTSFDYSFRLQFGLDAFTADEPTARLIDEAMQRDAPIYAEVAVTSSGRARLRALIVDGRRVE